MSKQQPVCPECGSNDIGLEATAIWDMDAQDWVLNSTFDSNGYCRECGADDFDPELRTVE